MNQNGTRGRVPRRTTIADQDHMLAYITPAEALMLRRNGGSGQPGPGGIPAYYHAAGHAAAKDNRYDSIDDQIRAEMPTLTNRYGVSLEYNQDSKSARRAYHAATAAARASGVDLSGGPVAAGRGVGTGTFRGGVEQLYEKDGNTISSTGYNLRRKNENEAQAKKAADAAKQNFGKPNKLGYGYFVKDEEGNNTETWVPPSIDMRDGGGKGIAGFYFGSSGGVDADKAGNNNNYVDKDEFENDSMKQGFGRVSNAIKATPLFSGRKPEGIAKFFQTGGLMGNLMGVEPPKVRANLKGQYTQEDINKYVEEQAARAQDASYRAATMRTSLDDEPGLNYVDPNAVTGDVIKQVAPIGGDTVVPQTNYITGTGIVPSNAFGMQNFNQQPYPQLGMATNLVTPNAFRPALTYAELLAGYTNPYGNKPAGVV